MRPALDPHRWESIQAIFDELVELDADGRARRLAALDHTNPALRAAVEALLAADADASARLASLDILLAGASDPSPDPLGLTGRTIAHFLVQEALGVGGMGVVYRGQDTRLGRAVALKFLLPHYGLDPSAKTRFLREARAAAALDHPHLCTIHDVAETPDGRLFLAMPLYAGETLKARLAREGPVPVADAVSITRQIVRGLGCAHAAGIIHRDLKPGNVMLLPDGTVKILDFGLAKALDETTSVTGAGFGTVAYMAPEQIRAESVDARADLWAVGVVLYEMLTGRKPFVGEQEVASAHAIVHAEPVAPSELREGVPAALDEILLGLLRKDRSDRYAGVDELLADLAALGTLEETPERGRRNRSLRPAHRRITAWQWLASLGAVLVIGGLAGTAITTWLGPGPSRPMTWYGIPSTDAEGLAAIPAANRIAISPDGDRIVYVGRSRGGNTQLWMRTRDQLHSTPVAGTEGAINPFFSPDGSRVGFFADGPGGAPAIKVVPLAGGTPMTVTDSAVDWGGGAWGYDGYIYFDGRLEGDGIARVLENGGVPEPVTRTDTASEEAWHFQPAALPNGKGVLFEISRGGDESEYDIGVVDVRTGARRVLFRGLAAHYTAGYLVYITADGILMAAPFDQDKLALAGKAVALAEEVHVGEEGAADLASSATGRLVYASGGSDRGTMLVWVTRDGKETQVDTTWRARFTTLALSPDGTQLAVAVKERTGANIWIKRLDQGPALKLTSEGDLNDVPAWTPDGRAVTFLSNSRSRSKRQLDLYLAMADGSALPQLLRHEAGSLWEAEYSRDGKWLVYRAGWDLFAVRTNGDTTRIPLVTTQFQEASPRLSPDGRWLAYSSNESGRLEVYVRPFPNAASAKWQVSAAGGASPEWSRNGRELFYRNDRNELVATSVVRGPTFAVGKQRVLMSVAGYQQLWVARDYAVSPDGTRFIMIRAPQKTRDELIVLENFIEALKPRVKH